MARTRETKFVHMYESLDFTILPYSLSRSFAPSVLVSQPEMDEEGGEQLVAAEPSSTDPLLSVPSPSTQLRRSSSVSPRRSSLLARSLRSIASLRKKRDSQVTSSRVHRATDRRRLFELECNVI